jgi:hypothetical protein
VTAEQSAAGEPGTAETATPQREGPRAASLLDSAGRLTAALSSKTGVTDKLESLLDGQELGPVERTVIGEALAEIVALRHDLERAMANHTADLNAPETNAEPLSLIEGHRFEIMQICRQQGWDAREYIVDYGAEEKAYAPLHVGIDPAMPGSESTVYRCRHGNYFHALGGEGAPTCGCFSQKTSGQCLVEGCAKPEAAPSLGICTEHKAVIEAPENYGKAVFVPEDPRSAPTAREVYASAHGEAAADKAFGANEPDPHS